MGIYPRNRIPVGRKTYPCAYIINTDFDQSPGKHWITIYFINKNQVEFCDSFGNNLDYYGLAHLTRGLNVSVLENLFNIKSHFYVDIIVYIFYI